MDGEDEEPESIRGRLEPSLRLIQQSQSVIERKAIVGMNLTHSSLSLRPLLFRPGPASTLPDPPSFLLSSIALRICSDSSYAASRLFIVDRLLWAKASALGLDFNSLGFREEPSRGDGSGDACGDGASWTGRYRECFCLRPHS